MVMKLTNAIHFFVYENINFMHTDMLYNDNADVFKQNIRWKGNAGVSIIESR